MKTLKLLLPLLISSLLLVPTKSETANPEKECLAKNIYFEARGEPFRGKVAVAQVTLNRVKSATYANTICGVVYQPYQFSWTRTYNKIVDREAWAHAKEIAEMVLRGDTLLPNFNATHFHATKVKPAWSRNKRPVAKIGKHVFY